MFGRFELRRKMSVKGENRDMAHIPDVEESPVLTSDSIRGYVCSAPYFWGPIGVRRVTVVTATVKEAGPAGPPHQ